MQEPEREKEKSGSALKFSAGKSLIGANRDEFESSISESNAHSRGLGGQRETESTRYVFGLILGRNGARLGARESHVRGFARKSALPRVR